MIHWLPKMPQQMDYVQTAIERNPATFKIILKTKDDPALINKWIKHHASIVGYENLIIFDNESSDPEVESIYSNYKNSISIFSYGGDCDRIHKTSAYPYLFSSIKKAAKFFSILDTDEFLIWIADDSILPAENIVGVLREFDGNIIPGTWLGNLVGSFNRFRLDEDWIRQGLQWGKPIISTTSDPSGFLGHNCQVKQLFSKDVIGNCFVLHRNMLIPKQRIVNNLNKLINFNVIPETEALKHALQFDFLKTPLSGNHAIWIKEIQNLSKLDESAFCKTSILPNGTMEINDDGHLEFSSYKERLLLKEFISNTKSFAPWMML